ncbi:hypothetical protein MXB_2449 [Myxobolus squamalis]|nr:hypothetical protein MXB_2449 [Myxobolus squamalis]
MAVDVGAIWELNKENIIPLVGGRSANLVVGPKDKLVIQKAKNEFEKRLHSETENKLALLDVWSDYIYWHEQNIMNGEGTKELIERALGCLDQENVVFHQEKYVKIWLKYVKIFL